MLTHLRYFGIGFNPVTFYYCFDRDDTRVETIVAEITNTPWKDRHAYVLSCPAPAPVVGGEAGWLFESTQCALEPAERRYMDVSAGQLHTEVDCEGGGEGHLLYSAKGPLSLTLPHDGGGNKSARLLRFRFNKSFHVSPFMPMQMEYDWRFSSPSQRLTVHMQNMQDGAKLFDATLDLQRREITGASLASALVAFPFMTAQVVFAIYWQALRLWLKRIPFHSHPNSGTDHEHDARPSSAT